MSYVLRSLVVNEIEKGWCTLCGVDDYDEIFLYKY